MSDAIDTLNQLDDTAARAAFARCCGSSRWVSTMLAARPFASARMLHAAAETIWRKLQPQDWLEAFTHHPRIGDIDSLRKKFATTAAWAAGEQAGASAASEETLRALSDANHAYEARFGYIFIVCATGKSANEMLQLLHARLANDPAEELPVACAEQEKITRLRLDKLLAEGVTP